MVQSRTSIALAASLALSQAPARCQDHVPLQHVELRSRAIVDTASELRKELHDLQVTLTIDAAALEDLVGASLQLPGLKLERFGLDERFDEAERGYSGGAWVEAVDDGDPQAAVRWRVSVVLNQPLALVSGDFQLELFGERLGARFAAPLVEETLVTPSSIEVLAPASGESVARDAAIILTGEPLAGEFLCLETSRGPQRDLVELDSVAHLEAGQRAFAIPSELHGAVRLLSIRQSEATASLSGVPFVRRIETIRAHWFHVAADPFQTLAALPRVMGIAELDHGAVDPLGTMFWGHAAVPCGEGFVHVLSVWGGSFEALHRVKEVAGFLLSDVPGADARFDKAALRRAIGAHGLCFVVGPREELADAIELVEEFGVSGWGIPSDIALVDGDPAALEQWSYDGVLDEVTSALLAFAELEELPLIGALEAAVASARASGAFRPIDELLQRGSLARFYTATLAELGFGLWEGNADDDGGAVSGMFPFSDRAGLEAQDPAGWAVFQSCFGPTLDVLALVHPDFEGQFHMARRPDLPYTARSQYLVRAQLRGARNSGIVGNDRDNVLGGNSGDNVLVGGGGRDVVTFQGARAEYRIELIGGAARVTDLVEGRDGRDLCLGVELLRFSDGDVTVPGA